MKKIIIFTVAVLIISLSSCFVEIGGGHHHRYPVGHHHHYYGSTDTKKSDSHNIYISGDGSKLPKSNDRRGVKE
jgi:hypothetical protein